MKVSLGTVILNERKKKHITQQQLADFMGVSKTSVSKWENEYAYPDITLLPLLAAYFDISIDSLLNYEPELNKEEIQQIYLSLQKSFETQEPKEVWKSIKSLTRRYYSCYPFILQIGLLILNHFDRLPGEDPSEQKDHYVGEALNLFIHIRTSSSDTKLVGEATKLEGFCLLLLNRPDDVLETLGSYVENYIPTDDLIASAYQQKGQHERAAATAQSGIYQNTSVLMSALTNYTQLVSADFDKFEETFHRQRILIETFNIEYVNPSLALNAYLSAAVVYAQYQSEKKVYYCLQNVIEVLEKNQCILAFNSDGYFNLIQDWLDHLPLGDHTPKSSYQVIEYIGSLILTHPAFDLYKESEEMIDIVSKIKTTIKRSK
ncbi:helix-turn-helix domain-containing protein [Marinilactibacillus sp. GCM10026970]|uniref:helix-turn-helix domain-containing protein n=1 Tax=Marinilactibacillus sp. GCM10026970 TaxID=3252642 RepID=UPI00360EDD4F